MNKLERIIYNTVKGHPAFKKKVRNIYQGLYDLLPKPKAESAYPIIERKGFFYGFHDHSPFSGDNLKLLANHASFDLRMPKKNDTLQVGFFNGKNHLDFNYVAITSAWNWHMGCKLQWRGNSNELIFNDNENGQNIARLINVDNLKETKLPGSVGSVSPDGLWAIGYSFARVNKYMPGYGYCQPTSEDDLGIDKPSSSGIYKIDLKKNEKKDIIAISDLAAINSTPSMNGAKHFVTHTVISPDSCHFIFLHRWIDPDGDIAKRFSRLVVSDMDGNILDIFKTQEMVSHIGWRGSNSIVAYCDTKNFGDNYVMFEIGSPEKPQEIGAGKLSSDGHPSFDHSGRWMLTDTYPDRRRIQNLILYDIQNKIKYIIARLPSYKKFQSLSPYDHWTCDLHPRWNRKSNILCFDSTFNGERSLCTINLNSDLLEKKLKFINNN
jgi:hypothetical protein